MSIKQKIMLSYLLVALLIGLLGGLLFYHDITMAETIAMNEAETIAKTFSLLVVHEFDERRNYGSLDNPAVRRELQAFVEQFSNIQKRDIVILDTTKRIIADVIKPEVGTIFSHDRNNEAGQTLKDGRVRYFIETSAAYPRGIKGLVMPVNGPSGVRIGAMILEYTPLYDEIMKSSTEAAKKYLAYYLGALLLSLLIGYYLSRTISRPLQSMQQAALKVAAGDFDSPVDHRSGDELGLLAKGFNDMMASLRQSRDRLVQSNEELKAESELRKKSEEALIQSEEKFRTFFESANDGLFILGLKGNFIDINRTAYTRLGYAKDEMMAMQISQLDSAEFSAKLPERFALLKSRGEAIFESAHLRKDGTSMPVEVNARTMDLGGNKVLFSVIRDITERRQAEDALKKANARLQALIYAIPDMVFFKDIDGRHLIVNKAVENVLGRGMAEIVGKTVHDLMPSEAAEACRISDEKAMQQSEPTHAEEEVPGKDGSVRYYEFVKAPIFDSRNNSIGLVTIGRDITERKWIEKELAKHSDQLMGLVEERTGELKMSNEKLLREIAERERMEAEFLKAQKLESVGILAGGIAHDFNNLLTAVLGNISMALLDLDQEHRAYKELMAAERASLRAQDLTQQLLTFSKGGAPVKRTMSLGELIRESAGFALRGSRTRCEFSLPGDLWLVDADEGQMSQVIHNLMINGDQAMPEGGTITVKCENALVAEQGNAFLRPGRHVKITVSDTGIGISKEHQEKIFDPYFTTKRKGSGLGLATTYAIIQKHSGYISVESERSVGTTFTIYLPASQATETMKKTGEAALPLQTARGRVLIMDDEQAVRETTGSALRRLGYSVEFAEDGVQAIGMYRAARETGQPFAAVIMDLTVPGGMGGQEAIQRLIEIDPAVKAIVSSGYSNDPIMANYGDYGFAGVVTKPYRVKELAAIVSRVITKDNPEKDDRTAHRRNGAPA